MDIFTLKGTISVDATDAKNDIDAVKKAAEEAKTALDNLKAAANNAEGELDQVATAANNAETELEELKTASNGAESELDQLETAASGAAEELKDVDTHANQATAELRALDTAADNAAEELKDIDTQGNKAKTTLNQVGQYAVTTGTALDEKGTFSVGAAYAANMLWELTERAAEFAWELGKMGMNFNASMETWSLQLTTLLGTDDIEVGKAFLEEIRQFAIDTPLALDQAVQSAVGLLASGINSEDVIDTLWMLGDIAMGDTEKLSRIALVYSQIMAGGKMQGDDLRQFKNAGVPIYDLLEQYYEAMDAGTDYTHDMLADMQKEGQITAEDVHGALLMATQEGGLFYNAMADMMEGYEGQTEKFRDTTQQTMGELTASFFELMKSEGLPKLTQMMTDLMKWAKENPEIIQNLSKALSDLAIGGLTLVVDGLKELLTFWDENRVMFDSLLVFFGGMAFAAGHPLAGAALITVGGYDVWNSLNETADADLPPERTTQEILEDIGASQATKDAAENGTMFSDDYSGDEIDRINYVIETAKEKGSRVAYAVAKSYDDIAPIIDPMGTATANFVASVTGKEKSTSMVELAAMAYSTDKKFEDQTGRGLWANPFVLAWHKLTDFSNVDTDEAGVPIDYWDWDLQTVSEYNDWREKRGLERLPYTKEEYEKQSPYAYDPENLPSKTTKKAKDELAARLVAALAVAEQVGKTKNHKTVSDLSAFLGETSMDFLGWPDVVRKEMETMWDKYRGAAAKGKNVDITDYMWNAYDAGWEYTSQRYDTSEDAYGNMALLMLVRAMEHMQSLPLDMENLPDEWFTSPYGSSGGGGSNPYDFPAPTSSADTATLIAAIQGLAQAYNPDAIAAAVESAIIRGMSGVTIEQGNVVLNTGSLVGTLTPILNQRFGALMGRASRG